MIKPIDITDISEKISGLEKLKTKLNPLLISVIYERFETPTEQAKKEVFFAEYDILSQKEKVEYRNFIRNVLIDMSEEMDLSEENNDDIQQLQSVLSQMKKMDRYEIYAWVLNHSQKTSVPEMISEPKFFIVWWTISWKWENINIGSVEYPKLNQFNSQWEYELELDIYMPKLSQEAVNAHYPSKLIISKEQNWQYAIYNQDRVKETSVKIKNGILQFSIPSLQKTFTLQIKE